MCLRKFILIFVFSTFFVNISFSQRKIIFTKPVVKDVQTKFINLNISDGLSNDVVNDIIQDGNGLMWICTMDGINTYDGNAFNVYFNVRDDSLSPQSSEVFCVEIDTKGKLYFGTKKGICVYRPDDNKFKRLSLRGNGFNNDDAYIRQIKSDGKNGLWVEILEGGLLHYDLLADTIDKFYKHNPTQQPYYRYHPIYYDRDSTLWIGGRGLDPAYLKKGSSELKYIRSNPDDMNKKRENDVASFYEDSRGTFWVSALDGIYLLNRKTETYKKFFRTSTWDILEDYNNNLWFAGGNGVYKYLPDANQMMWFTKDKDNPASLSSNSVYKVYEDYHGNLWFATNNGLSIYSPELYPFGSYSHIPGIINSPQGLNVTAVAENVKGGLWIGYEENGLDYFTPTNGNFQHYNKSNSGLSANEVSCLHLDEEDNKLWIGLWKGIGFNSLNLNTMDFQLFSLNKTNTREDWYNDLIEDNYGNFYIGFWGGQGLYTFDREKGRFLKTLKNKFPRLTLSRLITRFLKDNSGNIWFGTTNGGLYIYYPEKDTSKAYFSDIDDNRGLTSNTINDLCLDNDDYIWIISNTLQKYIPENDSFLSFGREKGLMSNSLVSMLSDNLGNIWVATSDKGLFKFNVADELFTQYTTHSGLQSNKFSKGRLKLSTGELFFGGTNGFNLFSPGYIIKRASIPKPFFGNLYLNYKKVFPNLTTSPERTFSPDITNINIELNSTDAVNPERYQYQCIMEGYDEDWVNVDSKFREISYSFVPAGTYTFKYRIGDGERWSIYTAESVLIFREAFYNTLWFKLLIIIFTLLIIIAVVRQRIFDLDSKNKNLELQQRLFRLQMNPHFMFNSLLAIQNFVFKKDVKEAGIYIADFARLFRLILDNSRSEFVLFEKEIETLKLYLKLQSLRYNDKFTYKIFVDEGIDLETMMIPPMLAQPIIENAIEHGIFKKDNKGFIEINYKLFPDKIYFEVVDDGVGLTATKHNESFSDHKSSALEITRERLKVLARKHKFVVKFSINEITDNESIKGTRVGFYLPFKYRIK